MAEWVRNAVLSILDRYSAKASFFCVGRRAEAAPDLVAEVVSPGDSSSDVEEKAIGWLTAGVTVVLVVDPQTRTIRQYRSSTEIRVHTDGFVDLGQVMPGFRLDVAELFR